MHLNSQQQQDEIFCPDCGKRWDVGEDEPPCSDYDLSREEISKRLTNLRDCVDCYICGPNWCGLGVDRDGPCHTQPQNKGLDHVQR